MAKQAKTSAQYQPAHQAAQFNYNKLQAVLCIAASAAVSIGLIAWAVTALI